MLNRFLLAEDPRNDGGGLAIVHTIDPIGIIGLIPDHVQHSRPFRRFTYRNSDGVTEEWTLYVHHYFTTNMALLDDEEGNKAIDKLLTRAWHWYKSYMEWEDNNIDLEDHAANN